jgi:hypothetical protein
MTRIGVFAVALCLCSTTTSFAQSSSPHFDRGWIDVNIGLATAAEDSLEVTTTRTQFQEPATYRTIYHFPRGAEFDFGGGVMLTEMVGVGLNVSGTAHQDTADLYTRIPHPLYRNAFGEDSGSTDTKLERTEGTIHLQGVFVLPTGNDRLRVRVFGGPSYFRLKMDAVTAIHYLQTYQLFNVGNIIDITTYDSDVVEHTGWGFHAGGDVSFFFTRIFGVGGVARFSRGTVTIDDTNVLREGPFDVKTGGFQLAGGLRLKF